MKAGKEQKGTWLGRWPLAVAVVLVVGALGTYAWTRTVGASTGTGTQPTYRVQKGPLTISVTESGTIKSLEQVALKSEVEGQATLIYLIPEGTRVEEGTLLAELDGSSLQDSLTQQQISVDSADASFVTARENLAVTKNQAESDISKAELDHQFAEEDLTQYLDGQLPKEVKEAEANITLAKEEMERNADKLKWSERLYQEKYISQTEYKADELTFKRSELNHDLAVASLALLNDYTSKRKTAELQSNIEQTAMALERVKLQANANIVQAEASLKARETELRQQRSKFEKTQSQLAKTKIYAPRSGLVVYATSVQTGGRRWSREPLQEGQAVREREELIYLPSAESMMAEIQIHESSLDKVRVGQPVRIKVDALPDQAFTGRVAKIAPLPDAQAAWMNPDLKVYATEIHLDGSHPELRTGMSCEAEIVVEQHADALRVPVQAVTRIGLQPTVYVRSGSEFKPHPIQIGLDNNSMVHVISGLEPGQEVLLTPPLEAHVDVAQEPLEMTPTTPTGAPTGTPTGATGGAGPGAAMSGGPSGPGAAAGAGPQGPGAGGQDQASDDDRRARMRERFEKMTPEEREAFMEKMRQRGGGMGQGGGPGQGGGSERGGMRGPGGGSGRERGGEGGPPTSQPSGPRGGERPAGDRPGGGE
ncbi:MAG: efflux RND transporter periplasmic adaptor subunit [Phycisphaerae bacterium]|jgi:HlyD family secretion protein